MIPATHALVFALALFIIGLLGFLIRKNVLVMLMCLELMLTSAVIVFVTFSHMHGDARGQAIPMLIGLIVASQAALGLAMLLLLYRRRGELNPTSWERLKDW